MIIKICEKCHKPITCPLDACVCHAIKSEREEIRKIYDRQKDMNSKPKDRFKALVELFNRLHNIN